MSDIVERLRANAEVWRFQFPLTDALTAAASEIERLRAQLAEREWRPTHRHWKGALYQLDERTAQAAGHLRPGDTAFLYRNEAGELFIRERSDFEHGREWAPEPNPNRDIAPRFTPLPTPPTPTPQGG